MSNEWRIEFAEKPLHIGIFDNMLYNGRDAGHSFLRLVDAQSRVVGELHGFSYDHEHRKTTPFSFNPLKRLTHIFKRAAEEYVPNTLKIFHYDGEREVNPEVKAQTMFSGHREMALLLWIRAIKGAVAVNEGEYEYRPFSILNFFSAQNCHTASAALLAATGLSPVARSHFATPGIQNTLHNEPSIDPLKWGATTILDLHNAIGKWSTIMLEQAAPDKIQYGPQDNVTDQDASEPEELRHASGF